MDNSAVKRIITLIDMDCFYCQVELRLDPSLAGKPVAVVQYNQWKQGGIIAVNYEARDRGVTRLMRGAEAQKVCPELCLPAVPSVRGKADLTRYRDAGAEVAEVFASFSDCVLRASIDEAFIDLTALVDERIQDGKVDLCPEKLPATFVVGFSDLKSNDAEGRKKGTMEWVKSLRQNPDPQNQDYRLAVGALIVEEIRSEVFKRTGFHCSGGIGHNKILAKLVAGLHKPKCQTVIPHENVPELYETLPLHKVRNLGGKLGKTVARTLSISFMSELYNFSKEELTEKFGAKNGAWLYDIARGIDHEEVTARLIPESIGCSKNFPGPTKLNTKEKLQKWLKDMAEEVVERLEKDQTENVRRANLLTVSFRLGRTPGSRSCPLTAYKVDTIAKDAFDVLSKLNQASSESSAFDPAINNLGLSASKFTSLKSTIKTFFKGKTAGSEYSQDLAQAEAGECSTTEELAESKFADSKSTNKSSVEEGLTDWEDVPIEAFAVNLEEETCIKAEPKPEKSIKRFFSETRPAEDRKAKHEAPAHVKLTKGSPIKLTDDENSNCSHTSERSEPSRLPSKSFFAKVMAQKVIQEPAKHQDPEASSSEEKSTISTLEPSSSTSDPMETEPSEDEWTQICPECNEKVHLSVYLEHLDFHTAAKLDRALNGRPDVKTAPARKSPVKVKESPVRKKRKILKPVDQKEITTYFTAVQK